MSEEQVVVVKVPRGASAPEGCSFVRSTRAGDIYHRIISVPSKITRSDIDDLSELFNNFGINNVAVLPVSMEPAFLRSLDNNMSGGKSKKHRRNKKSRKSRRR